MIGFVTSPDVCTSHSSVTSSSSSSSSSSSGRGRQNNQAKKETRRFKIKRCTFLNGPWVGSLRGFAASSSTPPDSGAGLTSCSVVSFSVARGPKNASSLLKRPFRPTSAGACFSRGAASHAARHLPPPPQTPYHFSNSCSVYHRSSVAWRRSFALIGSFVRSTLPLGGAHPRVPSPASLCTPLPTCGRCSTISTSDGLHLYSLHASRTA